MLKFHIETEQLDYLLDNDAKGVSPETRAHLEACVQCNEELNRILRTEAEFPVEEWNTRRARAIARVQVAIDQFDGKMNQEHTILARLKFLFSAWMANIKGTPPWVPGEPLPNFLKLLLGDFWYVPVPTRLAVMTLLIAFTITSVAAIKLDKWIDPEIARLTKANNDLNSRNAELQLEIARLMKANNDLNSRNAELQLEIARLMKANNDLNSQNAQLSNANPGNSRPPSGTSPVVLPPGLLDSLSPIDATREDRSVPRNLGSKPLNNNAQRAKITLQINQSETLVAGSITFKQGLAGEGQSLGIGSINSINGRVSFEVDARRMNGWHLASLIVQKSNGTGGVSLRLIACTMNIVRQ